MGVCRRLEDIYEKLYVSFGPQSWWPGQTRFEIIVGAILTQNTNWLNVEKAIKNLRKERLLTPLKIKKVSLLKLTSCIKPAGFFNVKAKRLRNFVHFLFEEYGGNLNKLAVENLSVLRPKLLNVNGVGPETADSILLYAFKKEIFVVDAYTKRLLTRHKIVPPDSDYHNMQKLFMECLPSNAQMFNEYHALIVRLAKEYCKTKPQCEGCPLNKRKYYFGRG